MVILNVIPLDLMLDIHIATSFDTAAKTDRLHGIPLEEHALLFGDLDLLTGHPMILRMEDYWSDARFSNDSVSILADEINSLKSQLPDDSLKLRMLDKLEDACKNAKDAQQSIFILAD